MQHITFFIGLPKTGTTFLRHRIFPSIFKNHNYKNTNEIKKILRDGIETKNLENGINLFAYEGMVGGPNPNKSKNQFIERSQLLNELKNLGVDVRLILVLREHSSWLRSCYKHYLVRQNESFSELSLNNFATLYRDKSLSFLSLLKRLKGFDILLLKYSDLVNDPENFIKSIIKYSGLKDDVDVASILKEARNSYSTKRAQISPKTRAALKSATCYNQVYNILDKIFFGNFKRILRKTKGRDTIISIAHKFFESQSIHFEDIKDDTLIETFNDDWIKTWRFAKNCETIKTLEYYFDKERHHF